MSVRPAPASVTATSRTFGTTAAIALRRLGRDRQRTEIDVLAMIAGLDRLVDGVPGMRQGREGHSEARPVVLVHAVVFGHEAFLERLARVDLTFEDDLGVGRHQKIDALRRHHADRRVEQAAGTFDFVVADAEIEARRQLDRGMSADGDGDLQRLPGFGCAAREQGQMVVRRDAHHGGPPVMDGEARERGVAPSTVRIARQDDAGGDVVPRLAFKEAGDRQRSQRRFRDDDVLDATGRHLHGLHRGADRLVYARHDFGNVDAQCGGDPGAAAQKVSGDAQRRSADLLEQHRRPRVGGREERRELERRIDRLGDAQ